MSVSAGQEAEADGDDRKKQQGERDAELRHERRRGTSSAAAGCRAPGDDRGRTRSRRAAAEAASDKGSSGTCTATWPNDDRVQNSELYSDAADMSGKVRQQRQAACRHRDPDRQTHAAVATHAQQLSDGQRQQHQHRVVVQRDGDGNGRTEADDGGDVASGALRRPASRPARCRSRRARAGTAWPRRRRSYPVVTAGTRRATVPPARPTRRRTNSAIPTHPTAKPTSDGSRVATSPSPVSATCAFVMT